MASSDDEGQIILLAGILLVLAFILFSMQLALLTNLGQQVGREAENPLLEDYLLVRLTFEDLAQDELRNAAGDVTCPNLVDYSLKIESLVGLASVLEANRGQLLSDRWVGVTNNTATSVNATLALFLADGHTTVSDVVTYGFACSGAVDRRGCPNPWPASCILL